MSVPTDFFQSSLALGSLMQVRQGGSTRLLAAHIDAIVFVNT